jgi:hypothetical protein
LHDLWSSVFFSIRVMRVFFFCFFILLVIPNWLSFPFRDLFFNISKLIFASPGFRYVCL